MAWASLSTRIASLPTVLAGPILRTVTETSVTVWLALRESATVTLEIVPNDAVMASVVATGSAVASKIGPNLYLVAVTATTSFTPLSVGTLYFYRLGFVTANGTKDLVAATGAKDISEFAYPPHVLPSFLLPPNDLTQVRISLGSCRKLHTDNSDALTFLDDTLGANVNSVATRPQLLVLGGDQIYADEVAESLLMMLTDAGRVLLGQETLPVPANAATTPDMLTPGMRTKVIQAAHFTSDDTRSHLMGLGEYLAMYLFAWSDVLWRDPATGMMHAPPNVEDYYPLITDPDALKAVNKDKLELITQRTAFMVTGVYLYKVRRAFANIATYMILDDHEITDDFNMQRRFCDGVYGSALGMRVVQNGMIAYALCQHWGNAPDQFTGTAPGAKLLELFKDATDYPSMATRPELMTILGLHLPADLAKQTPYAVYHDPGSFMYNYTVEGKAFQLLVTDTRTWRSFPHPGGLSPPALLTDAQIAAQITSTPPLADRLLLVLVTTNMPPCPGIRQAGRDLPSLSHDYDSEDFFDSWTIEQLDFARTIVALGKKVATGTFANRVVLLSGDVHSSQATRMLYTAKQQVDDAVPSTAKVVFAQVVASALLNQSNKTQGEHTAGYAYVPNYKAKFGAQPYQATESFVGWNPLTMPAGHKLGTKTTMYLLLQTDAGPAKKKEDVKYDPLRPTQTTRAESMGMIWQAFPIDLSETPHYHYRLDYLDRTDSGIVINVTAPGTTPLWSRAAAMQTYAQLAVVGGDQQVGYSNLGDLVFVKGSGHPDWIARFTSTFKLSSTSTVIQWSRFDVSLDPAQPNLQELADP